jgi:hypothetical protein
MNCIRARKKQSELGCGLPIAVARHPDGFLPYGGHYTTCTAASVIFCCSKLIELFHATRWGGTVPGFRVFPQFDSVAVPDSLFFGFWKPKKPKTRENRSVLGG